MKGKIVYVNFVDKGGRVHKNMGDYFFETPNEVRYYIKFRESKVSLLEISEYADKEIEIEGEIRMGTWDSDDPRVQSRIGEYVVINKILK